MAITVFSHAFCRQHDVGTDHPECPERLDAINDQLIRSGLDYVLQQKDATAATRADLCRAHSTLYVNELFAKAPTEGHIWLDADTQMMNKTLQAALYAAGSGINAVDEVMQASDKQAFCAIRPPGHHATHEQAMGFCFFNNIAIAAEYALNHYKLKRVAIVDFDVHHGNGTEDIFKHEPRVLFCSSFEYPLYPNTGADTVSDHIINLPLPGGCKASQWRSAVSSNWLPALNAFAPELVLVSAGFDGHAEDEMAHFMLREDDYHWLATELKALANKHCQGRVVAMLEGGYALSALGRSVVAFLKGLM
ncbi:histone deacetylase family protein [Arsukibacterium sp.]|uniref:histone deacetylase family protein n=1 Tax=Arsukibacterium sp. TaxID=1977258 RepID=UPI003563C580